MKKQDFCVLLYPSDSKAEVVRGYTFEHLGHEFGVTKDNDDWKVYHLHSGRFIGQDTTRKKAVQSQIYERIERMGEEEFLRMLDHQPSLDEHLAQVRKQMAAFEKAEKVWRSQFNKSLPLSGLMMEVFGIRLLDVMKLDQQLSQIDRRYHPESRTWDLNGPDRQDNFSMKDALYKIAGEETAKLIKALI